MKALKYLLILTGVIFLTLLFLNQAPYPYIWIYALWIFAATRGFLQSHNSNIRAFCINCIAIFAALGIVETYAIYASKLHPIPATNTKRIYEDNYFDHSDPDLGYSPTKNTTTQSTLTFSGETIYNATYTIDRFSHRITPEAVPDDCALFFGGSFIFGEGVNDEETTPWLTARKLNIKTINYAFHGYGPHQMLANIESGRVKNSLEGCKPLAAVYLMINGHIRRSAGKVSWGSNGPRYMPDENNNAIRKGIFKDVNNIYTSEVIDKVTRKLRKSVAYNYFIDDRIFFPNYGIDNDISLLASIVKTSRDSLIQEYPGLTFVVLYWDSSAERHQKQVIEQLKNNGLEVILMSEEISDLQTNKDKYTLSKYDRHPNKTGQIMIADIASDHIESHSNLHADK
jgi:hypothetical protein